MSTKINAPILQMPVANREHKTVMVVPRNNGPVAPANTVVPGAADGFEAQHPPAPNAGTSPKPTPGGGTLTFHGGKVLDKPVFTPIYVGDYWSTQKGQADVAHNDAFAKEYGTSKHEGILHQYGVGDGSFGGSTVVKGANPKKFTEAQVVSTVKAQLAAGTVTKNAQGIYTVMLPPGTVLDAGGGVTSKNGLGGFHGSYNDANGKKVYYAVIAYSDSKGNGIDFAHGNSQDNVTITESHEWDEAATDADVNNGKLGWYDDKDNGEIGDLAISMLPLSKAWGKDEKGFAVQAEWSNSDGKFETAPDKANGGPVVTPHAKKPGTV